MRHRAQLRAEPASSTETDLERSQRRLTRAQGEVAELLNERDTLALRLWLDERMTQAEIAERLDRADRGAGGEGITYAATQKLLWRRRNNTVAV